jgi:probable selenium-dependent hydroxylase accessory protein YqeC
VVTPIPLNAIADALELGDHAMVALVGGGGKTTLLHTLGDQLRGRIVLTTTTRMAADEHGGHRVLLGADDATVFAAAADGTVVVWRRLDGSKALGVEPLRCDAWFDRIDHLIVEADGSRGRPFKAPGPFEPVIPSASTHVVTVVGADALGRVIADQCHRPLRVAALAGCGADRRLDPALAATVILHPLGFERSIPSAATRTVAITKVDAANSPLVDDLAAELRERRPDLRVIAIANRS